VNVFIVMPVRGFALDRSMRTKDADGRLHVADCTLTAAQVNGYLGSEIVDSQALGLEPGRVYQCYRDSDALKAAVDNGSFENLPFLIQHASVNAADPRKDLIAGSVSNVRYIAGKVIGDLSVWDQVVIDLIEGGQQRELSLGYRYTALPNSGVAPDGKPFDIRMVDISPQHLASVEQGRVTGAAVNDSAINRRAQIERLIPNINRL
jgi:hypothetical protein